MIERKGAPTRLRVTKRPRAPLRFQEMPPIRFLFALPFVLVAATAAGAQEEDGWGTDYHMGTFYAGLTNPDGAHLGVYCSDLSAQDNPTIRTGPYVLFSVPRRLDPGATAATVTFGIDGKATAVPMTATVEEASTEFDWGPSESFPTEKMKALVEAMRRGKALTVGLTDPAVTEPFTLAGSGDALENILDCGKPVPRRP